MFHAKRDHDVARLSSPISSLGLALRTCMHEYRTIKRYKSGVTIFNWGHHACPLTSLTGRDPACMHGRRRNDIRITYTLYSVSPYACNNSPASQSHQRKKKQTPPASQKGARTGNWIYFTVHSSQTR